MTDVQTAAQRIAEAIEAEAAQLGDLSYNLAIWRAVRPLLTPLPKGGRPLSDSSVSPVTAWRYRLMLFNPNGVLEADTQPEAALDAVPDRIASSLPAVVGQVVGLVKAFHGARTYDGLEEMANVNGLRVSLSRNGGVCWWHRHYSADGEQWQAKVRIERC